MFGYFEHFLIASLLSLHGKILKLQDYVQVLPTHGAGSACGNNISTTRTSTIGFEKQHNEALLQPNEQAFIQFVLKEQPAIPAYYKRMRPANQQGPYVLGQQIPTLKPLLPSQVRKLIDQENYLLIDTRSPAAFGGGYIIGSYNIGLGGSFTTWVGSMIEPGKQLIFLLDEATPAKLAEITVQLLRIGYEEQPYGYLVGGLAAWVNAGFPIEYLPQISVTELSQKVAERLAVKAGGSQQLQVLDVRSGMEWTAGHIAAATHIPGGELEQHLDELDKAQPLAVICGSGYRSSVASSMLARHGFDKLYNTSGGMGAWQGAKLTVTR